MSRRLDGDSNVTAVLEVARGVDGGAGLPGAGAGRRAMSRRLDGDSNVTAVLEVAGVWTEAPACPAPERDGGP
jgi:hypothetical protein